MKKLVLAAVLALGGIGVGAAAQADHTTPCEEPTTGLWLYVQGVSGSEPCSTTGTDPVTGEEGPVHCEWALVVVGSCE